MSESGAQAVLHGNSEMNPDPSPALTDDGELLRRYAAQASAAAFAELVRRHVDHVYSAALRRVNGDHALAQDVAQTVFADLARMASRIPPDMPPGGWLHRHTGFIASRMTDRERRRRAREQIAASMNPPDAAPDPEWAATAPLLDEALDTLPDADRHAIVLRFFEQRDYRSVGAALGLSDDSAQKKVSRALEKLRTALQRRGVAGTAGLASLLAVHSVHAAPQAVSGGMAAHSLAAAACGARTLRELIAGMPAAARWQSAAAAVVIAAAAAGAGVWAGAEKARRPLPPGTSESVRTESPPAAVTGSAGNVRPASAAEPAELSPEVLVRAAAAEWKDGAQRVSTTARALALLSRIAPEQMPAALRHASAYPEESLRLLLVRHLLSHWAESDPQQALAWVAANTPDQQRADLAQGVLGAWAAHNPDAVMGWAGKTGTMTKAPVSESVLATIFRTLAERSPETALQRLRTLANVADRGQALRGILDTVDTAAKRDALAAGIAAMPDEAMRVQARRAMVEQWSRQDIQAAADYVDRAEPAWERTRLMDSLGYAWLQTDPAKAAAWWTSRAPGPDTLVKIINVWAQQDPNAAGEWLRTQPQGAASDTARMTFSRQVADLDPESALRWAETVSDAPMRESTIDHVFSGWKSTDAAAAADFLKASGWPEERAARLR